jgi:flavorubredoxin
MPERQREVDLNAGPITVVIVDHVEQPDAAAIDQWSCMMSIDQVPLICVGTAKGMLVAQLRHWRVTLGLLEDGDDLAIGKTGRLHTELSKI